MKRPFLIAVLVLLMPLTAYAQQIGCASGVACGPVPWQMPVFPVLRTPTPVPTAAITAIQTSGDVLPTATPMPAGASLDVSGITGQLATITALSLATPVNISDAYGSYATPATPMASQLGQQAGTFFGYVRGLTEINFGAITPLIVFALAVFGFLFTTFMATVLVPMIAVLVGIVRKIVSLILDFLPL